VGPTEKIDVYQATLFKDSAEGKEHNRLEALTAPSTRGKVLHDSLRELMGPKQDFAKDTSDRDLLFQSS
jgi:hypothetical protein